MVQQVMAQYGLAPWPSPLDIVPCRTMSYRQACPSAQRSTTPSMALTSWHISALTSSTSPFHLRLKARARDIPCSLPTT